MKHVRGEELAKMLRSMGMRMPSARAWSELGLCVCYDLASLQLEQHKHNMTTLLLDTLL